MITMSGGGATATEARSSDKARDIFAGRSSGIDFSTSWRISTSGLTINIAIGLASPIGEGFRRAVDMAASDLDANTACIFKVAWDFSAIALHSSGFSQAS